MRRAVPKNVAAAVGLVPTVLGGVRRLPVRAVQLPVMAVGSALAGIEGARREYDELADRGERLLARLRGGAQSHRDAQVAVAGAAAPATRTARPDPAAPAQPAVTEPARDGVRTAEASGKVPSGAAARPAPPRTGPTAARTPAAPVPDTLPFHAAANPRHDSAAPDAVVERVDAIADSLGAPAISDHAELPLADYDHMTLGSLRGRLRSLSLTQLVQLRDYEKSKADRLPVVTMLDNRIARLASGESTPSDHADTADQPAASRPPRKIAPPATETGKAAPARQKVRTT